MIVDATSTELCSLNKYHISKPHDDNNIVTYIVYNIIWSCVNLT